MHNKIFPNKISAITALILFFICTDVKAALPLTETIYTIPENGLEISLREQVLRLDDNFRKETYSLGIGLLPNCSIWYSFDYLHNDIFHPSSNILGDSYLKIWLYAGDYFGIVHTGMLFFFRIPTGPDSYAENNWRNVSFGNNELKIGPVTRIDFRKKFFLHLNLFYVFREGHNQGFYNGYHLNLSKKETYSRVFGLNFRSKDAFLSSDRLKNDYAVYSMAVNTIIIYPVIPYVEFYTSHRVYKKQSGEYENLPIEGAGINPVFLSVGGRYFFSESVFLGLYYIFNPKREKNFIKDIIGFDFSLQF